MTPATVMSGEDGRTARCASASDSSSHFQRAVARCVSSQPTSWVRSSASKSGRVREGYKEGGMGVDATRGNVTFHLTCRRMRPPEHPSPRPCRPDTLAAMFLFRA